METIDPATGMALPADSIQRVLFVANSVHVYNIPPLASTRGHMAASWTEDAKRHMATCRIRIIETASQQDENDGTETEVKTDVVLEESSTGQLFAAAPYTSAAVVEPAADSSRFFALRVQDPTGRKATLGIGFEERSDAFDFGVALQEAQRALGLAAPAPQQKQEEGKSDVKRDYSLKEGETITVQFGGSNFGKRSRPAAPALEDKDATDLSAFALPPPPSSSSSRSALPPPQTSAHDLGFDDGQNGEFA